MTMQQYINSKRIEKHLSSCDSSTNLNLTQSNDKNPDMEACPGFLFSGFQSNGDKVLLFIFIFYPFEKEYSPVL